LNPGFFISSRLGKQEVGSFSSVIQKIAIATIGLGLAVMLVSFLILRGFQDTVKDKIYGFSAHLQVSRYAQGLSIEEPPFSIDTDFYRNYRQIPLLAHVQEFAHKVGIIKTSDEVLGIVFKGVAPSFDTVRFGSNMLEGRFVRFDSLEISPEVVISKRIASKLRLEVGEDIIVHFFQNPPRVRKLKVVGLYDTQLAEYYDDKVIIGDLKLVQRLNGWDRDFVGGLEVFVSDTRKIAEAEQVIDQVVDYELYAEKVSDKYVQVFEWLGVIDRQVNIFLGIILTVVCINMISIILILIMERTQMIGMLKALGGTDGLIRSIFTYTAVRLISRGMILGNVLGLGLCAVQYFFQVIPLNPHDYYMSYVPIGWNWEAVVLINLLTFAVVVAILALPTLVIARIRPIKAIRFD
jgi:lipoprotein-releasing system permease protein